MLCTRYEIMKYITSPSKINRNMNSVISLEILYDLYLWKVFKSKNILNTVIEDKIPVFLSPQI